MVKIYLSNQNTNTRSAQALVDGTVVGVVVGRLSVHKNTLRQRGYIAMLAVDSQHRGQRIGRQLVARVLASMRAAGAAEVVLEAEASNLPALRLYESLGFLRDKRLVRYYLSFSDAWRLKLFLSPPDADDDEAEDEEGGDADLPVPPEALPPA